MNIHTPASQVLAKSSFLTAITAASNNGSSVNVAGYRNAMVVFESAPTGTGTTSNAQLQEAPDGSTWVNVTSGVFTTVTTAAANGGTITQVMNVNLAARQPYLRLVHTGAGGSAAGVAAGQILLLNADYDPVAQDQAVVTI